jgi:membrane-associated phospholipid phosphatase
MYFCRMDSTVLSASFWDRLDELDKWLFVKLNSQLTSPFLDTVLPFLRDSVFWAPLYMFILGFIFFNFGKKGFFWSIAFLCTIALTDLAGTYLFKQNFQRLRPCQDPLFFSQVRLLLKQCSPSYSFVSNHAANHFGLATFMMLTFRPIFERWSFLIYFWALAIAYAQVYVGVHYPSDVLGGALLGIIMGFVMAFIYHKNLGFFKYDHKGKRWI